MYPQNQTTLEQIFRDPGRAQLNLDSLLGAPLSEEAEVLLPQLVELLKNSVDADMALNNLERLSSTIVDRLTFLELLSEQPYLVELLILVVGCSQFLSDVLVRNPGYLELLAEPGWLQERKARGDMVQEMRAAVQPFRTKSGKMSAMRRYKRGEILRIGTADLVRALDFAAVTEQISFLAEACLEVACEIAWEESEFPPPIRGFSIIGLGKLGGCELNYSSDIDIMFVWSDSEERVSELSERYEGLAQRIMEIVGEITEEGYLFRVDARLRPEGTSGPLARSLESCLAYYENYGQPWERLALIKARPVAGDRKLGQAFIEGVPPFVYAKRLDDEARAHIRHIKERYEQRLKAADQFETDVKQGHGGIRDIEFSIQMLQLLCGANDGSVRHYNTLSALTALCKGDYLNEEEAEVLRGAYIFLRTLEHRLQITSELPLTQLPRDERELAKIAHSTLGEKTSAGKFLSRFSSLTNSVRQIYEQVMETAAGIAPPEREKVFAPTADKSDLQRLLRQHGFQDISGAMRILELMTHGPTMSPTREPAAMLDPLLPDILSACGQSGDPDRALRNFERFSLLCGPKDIFYLTLQENSHLIPLLGNLGGRSQFLSDYLIDRPQFFDVLTDREALEERRDKGQFLEELRGRMAQEDSFEARVDILRRFKARELLRIGAKDMSYEEGWADIETELSHLAEACLEAALEEVGRHVFGSSTSLGVSGKRRPAMAIVGLGKLGGEELHYSSDLDVIFVAAGWESKNEQQLYEQLAEEMISALGAMTAEGEAYKIDLRLRPGGQAGALVRGLEGYRSYFEQGLEPWERQAFVRARAVAGDEKLGQEFIAELEKAIYESDFQAEAVAEIVRIRQRVLRERVSGFRRGQFDLKSSRGGLLELEFLVRLLQLVHGAKYPQVREPNTARAIEALAEQGCLSGEEAGRLRQAHHFLKRLEANLQIARQRSTTALPTRPSALNILALQLGYSHRPPQQAKDFFLRDLQRVTNSVNELWEGTITSLSTDER